MDAFVNAAPRILLLAHRDQRFGIRTFDADENGKEVGPLEHRQQIAIVGQIERSLGGEFERIIVLLHPFFEHRQERFDRLFVADEIIVDEIDVASITEPIERLKLGKHLVVRLGARRPAVKLDDVAELASERAAARELHPDVKVLLEFQQIEARHRRLGDVDLEFLGHKHALAAALLPGRDELPDDVLDFAKNTEICAVVAVRTGRCIGTTNDDRQAAGTTHFNKFQGIRLLEQHAAGHHHIGPVEIALGQLFGVTVDQPHVPGLRQQGRYRDETERNRRISRPNQFAGFRKVPERIRHEPRIDHEHVARAGCQCAGDDVLLLFQETPPRAGKAQFAQYGGIGR